MVIAWQVLSSLTAASARPDGDAERGRVHAALGRPPAVEGELGQPNYTTSMTEIAFKNPIRRGFKIFKKSILYLRRWKRWSRSLELHDNYDVNASAFSVRITNKMNSHNVLITLPTVNKLHRELLSRNWYTVLLMGGCLSSILLHFIFSGIECINVAQILAQQSIYNYAQF